MSSGCIGRVAITAAPVGIHCKHLRHIEARRGHPFVRSCAEWSQWRTQLSSLLPTRHRRKRSPAAFLHPSHRKDRLVLNNMDVNAEVLDRALVAIVAVDATGRISHWNRVATTLFGRPAAEVIGQPFGPLLLGPTQTTLTAVILSQLQRGAPWEGDILAPTSDDRTVPVALRVMPFAGTDGAVAGFVAIAVDLTERRAVETELTRQALHDPLTNLPNRLLVMDRLAHALALGERKPGGVAVLFLDLDRFKLINDSLSHDVGDQVLVAVAERLHRCLRPEDTLGRFAGDEFIVVLEGVDADGARALAERILTTLREPLMVDDHEVVIGSSIGTALADDVPIHPGDLLRNADAAMYQAKATGKGTVVVFEPRMRVHAVRQLDLEADLRRARQRHELRLHYQPVVDLVSGRVVGLEALVRWAHPRHGLLLPDEFLPLAEEAGLADAIGAWVLREACRQGHAWAVAEPMTASVMLSVNISARHLHRGHLIDQVCTALAESKLSPGRLRLEVTEHAVLEDVDAAVDTLANLEKLGVQLALDDFGTGHSALNYLSRLPFTELKIDRSFVAGFDHDRGSLAVARAITTLAHDLGMAVTAEGIETIALTYTQVIGSDRGQGQYFGPGLPAADAANLITNGPIYLLPHPSLTAVHAETEQPRPPQAAVTVALSALIALAEGLLGTHRSI